jgi:Pyruvate/2-oxoacid:ferredoxin oxidoreductase delta subunit
MTKVLREIISVDEEKCDGCGLCVPSCAEGALQVIDGKLRLVKESFCDGLGVCLGECPQGALAVIEAWVEPFDESAAMAAHGSPATVPLAAHASHHQGAAPASCPSLAFAQWQPPAADEISAPQRSELRQWPVQLHLLPTQAPFFQNTRLAIIADCVPFADPNTHARHIKDSAIAVGCPKLDDARAYVLKLSQILAQNDIHGVKVVRMEVPCCGGLEMIARQAMALGGVDLPLETEIVGIR